MSLATQAIFNIVLGKVIPKNLNNTSHCAVDLQKKQELFAFYLTLNATFSCWVSKKILTQIFLRSYSAYTLSHAALFEKPRFCEQIDNSYIQGTRIYLK